MTANEWNTTHKVGTAVTYTPTKGRPEITRTTTRSKAWTLGHGAAVVAVVAIGGVTGGVSLDHLVVTR